MSPDLVRRVLAAKALVDGRRSGRCRGNGTHFCKYPAVDDAPACLRHLTPEELEAEALVRRWAQPLVDRWLFQLPPACWFWPLPAPAAPRGWDTPATFMFDWQKGRCAVCAISSRRGGLHGLVLDHDHASGLARGYLCRRCNKRESHTVPDDGRCPNYRRLPPAALLGLTFRYGPAQVPAPRTAPVEPVRDATPARLRRIRRQAEQVQPLSTADDAKARRYTADEAWRTLEALVPVLRSIAETAQSDPNQQRLQELTDWLRRYPPRPPDWT